MFTNYACMPNYPEKHPAGKFAPPRYRPKFFESGTDRVKAVSKEKKETYSVNSNKII